MTTKPKITSPYNSIAKRLIALGYAAIPILPGSKVPGGRHEGRWVAEANWQRFCYRLPTKYELSAWATWPEAGVCVVLGFDGVIAVDIDTDDPAITAAIMSVLPESPVGKRGAKGKTYFYRANVYRVDPETGEVTGAVKSRPYNKRRPGRDDERILDLLALGRQTVVPPTVHPDTKRAYEWITDTTLDLAEPADLPMLPDDISERLAMALAPFDVVAGAEQRSGAVAYQGDEETPWREVNARALANFDAWVPDLNLPSTKRSHNGQYRAFATWHGGNSPNLSFHPSGIKDMREDVGHSALDVVMLAFDATLEQALDWLGPRVGYTPPPLLDVSAMIANAARKRAEAAAPPVVSPSTGEALVEIAEEPASRIETDGLPDRLTNVPGLVGVVVDWINRTSRSPSPTLALGASLAFVGALAGRRYAGPTNLRTNVYVVGLAESGFGKDHARATIKTLAAKTNLLNRFFGGEDIKSGSALRARVMANPSLVYLIDEFGGFLRKISGPKAGGHEREILDDLLKMTGTANSTFLGADYAQTLAKPIFNPNVCIYGTSTPETFWRGLESGNIADGFLPRFIILDAGTRRPNLVKPQEREEKPPKWLLDQIVAFCSIKIGGNLTIDGSVGCEARVAPWGDGAERAYEDFVQQMFRTQDKATPDLKPIYARVAENAMRLSLIVAVGVNPESPVLDLETFRWGADLALASATMLIDQAEERVADNERQAEYKRVRAMIASAGKTGLTRRELNRRIKGRLDGRRLDDVVTQLTDAGEIAQEVTVPPGGGKKSVRMFAV
jgi:hypothetical protein